MLARLSARSSSMSRLAGLRKCVVGFRFSIEKSCALATCNIEIFCRVMIGFNREALDSNNFHEGVALTLPFDSHVAYIGGLRIERMGARNVEPVSIPRINRYGVFTGGNIGEAIFSISVSSDIKAFSFRPVSFFLHEENV